MAASPILPSISNRINSQQYLLFNQGNHQYVRAFGSLTYTKAISEFHKQAFKNLDHENNVVVVNGGVAGLFCSIMGLVNPG